MFFKFFKRNKSKNKVVSEANSSGNVFVDEKYTPGEGDFISRRFEILIDSDEFAPNISEVLSYYDSIKKWAYILHDKSEIIPHYHIYLSLSHPICASYVADWFEVPLNRVRKNQISEIHLMNYFLNTGAGGEYEYQISDIHSNFNVK